MNNKPPVFIALRILISFVLFKICITTTKTPIPNYDLSLVTLNPTKTGITIKGNAAGDTFGCSVNIVGDVNGDGYDDIVVGAQYKNINEGAVYIIYGGPTSSFSDLDLSSTPLDPASTGFTISGMTGEGYLGYIVNRGGDINKDGYDDIIIGARAKDQAYVIYGRETSLLQNIVLGSTILDPKSTGFTITGKTWMQNSLGHSVSIVGDVDGDGYDDIAVGAPYMNQAGEVYVIYGKDKSLQENMNLNSVILNPAVNGFTIRGEFSGDTFGHRTGRAGDVDKDGFADILIATPNKNSLTGAAYVFYGKQRSSFTNIMVSSSLNPATTGFFIMGAAPGDSLGIAVSTAGDINNDGFDDIIVGAPFNSGKSGAAYVIYGNQRASLRNYPTPTFNPLTTGFQITGTAAATDMMGSSVHTVRDLNGDDYDDIVVSSFGFNNYQGAVYVIYGAQKSDLPNIDFTSKILDPVTTGFMIRGNFGGSSTVQVLLTVSTAGDFNGDGYNDIIIGAPYKINAVGATGTVYVIHSACIITAGSTCSERDFCKTCAEEANPAETQCQVCPANCEQFLGRTGCQICDEGYFISNFQCASCSPNCKQCSSSTACEVCLETYFMHESKCFNPCPSATFSSEQICKDCPSECSSCTSLTSCQTCKDGYYFYKSQCLGSCPARTFASAWDCLDCPSQCTLCTSLASCQACKQGYTMVNSQCIEATPTTTTTTTLISPPQSLTIENTATQRLGSSVTGVGSAVCVGNPTFPLTKLVSKIVQNTRYLNLPVTPALAEIYRTWDADLISWDIPDDLAKLDHFKIAPRVFARYDIGSPFSLNFWSTIITIAMALGLWIVLSLLLFFFERKKIQGKIYSILEIFASGSLNFSLVQAYGCLDDMILYFIVDIKTNLFDSIFAWMSLACGVIFLGIGTGFMLMNIFKVSKYQKLKKEGLAKKDMRELEKFNQENKKWELFYGDFNDHDEWSHSFLAFLIVRSSLSSLIIAVLHEHILVQTLSLLILDVVIILFLIIKKPFATLRGKLAQYYFEVITLLVHICTFILGLQTFQSQYSLTLNENLCTSIIYLNTALVTGTTGFMFIEIYKTISQWIRSQKENAAATAVHTITEEVSDTSKMLPFQGIIGLPTNPPIESQRTQRANNTEQSEKFHFLSGFNPNQNISVNLQTSEADSSLSPDFLNSSDRIKPQGKANTALGVARRRLRVLTNSQNKSIFETHGEQVEVTELEIT